ncbi:UNVERIFIED_CONTAM: hypothetical protein HHA_240243 [Hammondia hammondi]|eukprot:XP_008887784.1 hypothetical protein HHA_240243 [Hammondia hammondi]
MTTHSVRGVSDALLGRRPRLASLSPLVFPHCFSHPLFLGCRLTSAKSVLTRSRCRLFSPPPFSTSNNWNRERPFSGEVRRETWTPSAAERSTPKQHRGSSHLSLCEPSSPLQFSPSFSLSASAPTSCAPRPLLCPVGSSSPSPPSLLSPRSSSPSLFSPRSSFASSPLPSAAPPSASSYLPASVRPPQNYRQLDDPRAGLYLHFLPFWARVTQPPSGSRFFLRVLPLAPLCCSAMAVHLVPLWGFESLARDLIGWSVYYAATLLASWWGMHAGMQLAHVGSPRSRGDRGPRNGVRFGFVAYGVAALIAASGAQQVEAAESLYLLAMACGLLLAGDFASHHAKLAPLWFWKERFLGISVCLAAVGALLLSEQLGTRGRQTRLEF